MDSFLRFFIKFYGYAIGVWSVLGSVFISSMIFVHRDFFLPLEEFYNFRVMGSSALILGLAWFCVGVSMIYGVFKENTKCLYPMPILYMIELFGLFIRDVVLIWKNEPTYKMAFLHPVSALILLYITMHILMSVVALARLFNHEPLKQAGMDFRRLTSNQESQGAGEILEDNDTQAPI